MFKCKRLHRNIAYVCVVVYMCVSCLLWIHSWKQYGHRMFDKLGQIVKQNITTHDTNSMRKHSDSLPKRPVDEVVRFLSVSVPMSEIDEALVSSDLLMTSTFVQNESFKYPNFNITEPNFANNRSRYLFFKNKLNTEAIGKRSDEQLIGKIYVVKNGKYNVRNDCGFRSSLDWVEPIDQRGESHVTRYRSVMPLLVPDGSYFQHFMDGTLPKIMQSFHLLKNGRTKIIMAPLKSNILNDFFHQLNLTDRILYIDSETKYIEADELVYTCITPPIHPLLWRMARRALGAPEILQVPVNEAYAVYVTREGCRNCGRRLLNDQDLIKLLESRYGKDNVKAFMGPFNLDTSLAIFGKARVVIGVHGGGMYNINFAPVDTAVIEIMPTEDSGRMLTGSTAMIWIQANMLGQNYWRVAASPENAVNDVNVNLDDIDNMLDHIDKHRLGNS